MAQSPDELKEKYFTQLDWHIYTDTDSALFFSSKLLALGKMHSDSLTIAEGYQAIGECYYYKNDLQKSIDYYEKAAPIFNSLELFDYLGVLYMSYGNVYSDLGQHAKCLYYYQESEQLLLDYSDYPDDRALLYYNMAHLFMDINDVVNFEKYIFKAKNIISVEEDVNSLNLALKNLEADLALRKGQPERARELAKKALKEARIEQDLIEVVFAFQNLGAALYQSGMVEKGIEYQDSALSVAETYGDQYMVVEEKNRLADYYLKAGKIEAAYQLARDGYLAGDSLNSLIITMNTALVYARVLEQKKQFEEALKLYKIYNKASDSLRSFDLSEKILQSENVLAESRNRLLQAEAKVLKANNAQQRFITIGTIIGLVLCLLIIVLLITILSSRRKTVKALNAKQLLIDEKSRELELKNEELEKMNNAKDKLFSIITHDMRQPFNQISSFIQILEHTPEIDNSLQDLIAEIKASTCNTLSAMNNLLIWSKSQFLNVKTYPENLIVKDLFDGILTEMAADINKKDLVVDVGAGTDAIIVADRNHIEIILRNLINNAAKFSPVGGALHLGAMRDGNLVSISIKDEGKGMTEDELAKLFDTANHFSTPGTLNEKGSGLGMLIVSEFVKENGGSINVTSQKNKGSTFKVTLPAGR